MSINGEKMLRAMSYVDGELIAAAEKNHRKKRLFIGIGSAAAAAAMAVTLGVNMYRGGVSEPPVSPAEQDGLPKITAEYVIGGQGSQTLSARDISEINMTAFLNEDTLPVYRSHSKTADIEEMKAHMLKVAEMLEIDASALEFDGEWFDAKAWKSTAELFKNEYGADDAEIKRMEEQARAMSYFSGRSDKVSIFVDSSFEVNVSLSFDGGVPEELRTDGRTEAEAVGVADLFAQEYSGFLQKLGITDPVFAAVETDKIKIYGRGNSSAETVSNYYFNYVSFSTSEDTLYMTVRTNAGTDRLGDYPLITAEQAQERIWSGQYLPVDYGFTGEENAAAAELCYRVSAGTSFYVPFYLFYVELPEDNMYYSVSEEGERCFAMVYVPAVDDRYLDGISAETAFNGGAGAAAGK